MKRHHRRTALILCIFLLFTILPMSPAQAASPLPSFVKVGLYYGSEGLSRANLQNKTGYGSGYTYGTMNPDGSLNYYGTLNAVEITVQPSGSTGFKITQTDSGAVLASVDFGGQDLFIVPTGNGCPRPETWFKGYTYTGSFLYHRNSYGTLNVINYVALEDYIKGVLPYEMNNQWPYEALRAQALAARSYTAATMGGHKSDGFDLCNSTDCQVYRGTKSANETTDAAVDSTAGMYITYAGSPIMAVYHASNGGATENSENIWNSTLPYLRAVADPWEAMTTTTRRSWTYEITLSQITKLLRARGNDCASIVHAYAEYTAAGNIGRLVFIDANGKVLDYEGESIRLMLRSTDYGIGISSQRLIFEDKANPRVTSPADFIPAPSGVIGTPLGTPITGSSGTLAADAHVLTSSGLYSAQHFYGGSYPVLTASGLTTQAMLTVTGGSQSFAPGSGTDSSGSASGAIDPLSLQIPASSSGTFIVSGGGNGHNLGMSQFGAKGMAEQGYTAEQIIAYYYTDISIQRLS